MTAPEPRPAGRDSNARGLVVIAVAVVVAFLLLSQVGNDDSSSAKTTSKPPSTTAPLDDVGSGSKSTTTTTEADTGRSPSEVKVIVLNGSGKAGAAKATSDSLGSAGYVMATPGNAPTTSPTTTVYYDDGYKADAIEVATTLGRGTDAVKPLGDASLGGLQGDASVVVVLGQDTPTVSSTTTTTSLAN